MQPVGVAEPVAAEQAAHRMPAARFAAFPARQRAQADVAVHVAVIEVACAERDARVPGSAAVACVHGARRLVELVAAVAAAEIALVLRKRGRGADQNIGGDLDVAADRDRVDVGVAVQEAAVEIVGAVVVARPEVELVRAARRVRTRDHPSVDRTKRRALHRERRLGEHADPCRALDHRRDELGDDVVRARRRMDAVGENERACGVGRHEIRVRAEQRRRRAAGGRGGIREAERARVGDHLVEQRSDVHADRRHAERVEAADQRGVEESGDRRELRGLAGRDAARRDADVRQVEHDEVAGAGRVEDADLLHEAGGGDADVGLQFCRRDGARCEQIELVEDVVCAAPDRVERALIERSAPGEQRDLRRDRQRGGCRRAVRHAGQARHARAALREVRPALIRGIGGQAVTRGEHLRPHRPRIGREQPGARRQHRLVRAAVGKTVAEVEDVRELRGGRRCGEREGDGGGCK